MQLIFNELSLNDMLCVEDGINYFHIFLNTYSKAVKAGFDRTVLTYIDLNAIQIAKNYYTFQWRNGKVDRDMLRRYQGLCDRQYICNENYLDYDVQVNERSGKGIIYAFLHDEVLFSMCSQEVFRSFKIEAQYFSVENEQEKKIEILNISCVEDVDYNLEMWIARKKIEYEEDVEIGEFLDKLQEYYPTLEFGKVARNQLENEIEQQHYKTIRLKLYELERVFSKWDGGQVLETMFQSKMTPESTETLKRFKDEHTFLVGDKTVLASYHIRYTGKLAGRIYFYPDRESKKCYICSLTTKLPTVSEPSKRL